MVTVAGAVVGLGAYLYVLGGIVVWLRLTAARLPNDDVLRAVDRQRLLAIGLKAFLFEVVVLVVLSVFAFTIWKLVKGRGGAPTRALTRGAENPSDKLVAWIILLQGLVIGVTAAGVLVLFEPIHQAWFLVWSLALALVWVGVIVGSGSRPDHLGKFGRRILVAVEILITLLALIVAFYKLAAPLGIAMLVFLVLLQLSEHLSELPSVRRPAQLIPSVLVVGAGLSLIIAGYTATPPVTLDRAEVVLRDGHRVLGGYVGESSEGVFLATCDYDGVDPEVSLETRLRVIDPDRVRRVVLGGPHYVLDYGKDPSLLDLARYVIHRDRIKEETDTVSMDLRGHKLVCGQRYALRLKGRTFDHGPGRFLQRAYVAGAGRVTVFGPDLKSEPMPVRHRGIVSVPVSLKSSALRELRRRGTLATRLQVVLLLSGGIRTKKESTLHLRVRPRPRALRHSLHE